MMQELKEFGVEDIHIYDTYFDDITQTIYNHIILNEPDIETDEFIHILDQMSEMLIENRQTDISLKISSEVPIRSEEHTSELQSRFDIVCRLLLAKKKKIKR